MGFDKLLPVDKIHIGCLNCSTSARIAPMDMWIAVGFGDAHVSKDDEIVYSESEALRKKRVLWTIKRAENLARKDPDHDWRIVKYGPLHGETFQRQGKNKWVCVESNRGFA